MGIQADLSDFNWLPELFERRLNLVQDLVEEGRVFTDAYVATKSQKEEQKRSEKPQRHDFRTRRLVRRIRRATGNQYARGVEIVAYHKFVDWWNRNW